MDSADEFKELGNKAFTAQDYNEAVRCYSEAIKLDSYNHIYFSNRSASYAGQSKWEEAIRDAKECIRLCPGFVKGYYRLVTAQYELGQLDAALATVKQGLSIDPDNPQLVKQLRSIKSKQQAQHVATQSMSTVNKKGTTSTLVQAANAAMQVQAGDSSISKEVADLQEQLRTSLRDYDRLNKSMSKTEKDLKMNAITLSELEKIPADADTRMYRGIGKMFLLASRSDVFKHLDDSIKTDEKTMGDMKHKKEYLERRMKSQQQNINELIGGAGMNSQLNNNISAAE